MAFLESIKVGATTYRFPMYHGSAPSSSSLTTVQVGSTSYSWLSGTHLLKNKNSLSRVITDINYKGTLYNLPGIEYLWTSTTSTLNSNNNKLILSNTASERWDYDSFSYCYYGFRSAFSYPNASINLTYYNGLLSGNYLYVRNLRVIHRTRIEIETYSHNDWYGATSGPDHNFTLSNKLVFSYSYGSGRIDAFATGYIYANYNSDYCRVNLNLNYYFTSSYVRLSTLQPSSSIPDGGHYYRFPVYNTHFQNNYFRSTLDVSFTAWVNSGVLFNR